MSAYNLTLSKTKTVLSYDAHMAKQECDWLNNNVRSSAALPENFKSYQCRLQPSGHGVLETNILILQK